MGYHTNFNGEFNLDRPLKPEHKAYLDAFNRSRRMNRNAAKAEALPDPVRLAAGLPIGEAGGYYVGASERNFGQDDDGSVVDHNDSPAGQPGLWCQWAPNEDGTAIVWDEGEKFYDYIDWIEYLIDNFLAPWGYVVNGVVDWSGEEDDDRGRLHVKDNKVKAVVDSISKPEPAWD